MFAFHERWGALGRLLSRDLTKLQLKIFIKSNRCHNEPIKVVLVQLLFMNILSCSHNRPIISLFQNDFIKGLTTFFVMQQSSLIGLQGVAELRSRLIN